MTEKRTPVSRSLRNEHGPAQAASIPSRRGSIGAAIVLLSGLVCGTLGLAGSPSEPITWLAPSPQTEDGRFANPVGGLLNARLRTRLPFFWKRIAVTLHPRPGAARRAFEAPDVRAAAAPPLPRVTWVGHATVLVELERARFLTDPIWSRRASPIPWLGPARRVEPGLDFDALPEIDFVLVSHSHFDHMDLPTLSRLAKRSANTLFYVPLGNAALLRDQGIENVIELDWTGRGSFNGLEIHCLPAQHWSKRSLTDTDKALWSSWAVIGPDRRFFFGGDTGYFSGFTEIGEALGPFDLAALPIGAYEPTEIMHLTHMNPEEAIQAAVDLRARSALAVHFGTFDLADEPLDEPPRRFLEAARRPDSSSLEAWVLDIGESRSF